MTIKDIAAKANVSTSIVSRIVNNNPCRVSKEKRELVLKIIKENNYHPNRIARSLVTKKTYTIGLIVPDIVNMFFSTFAKEVDQFFQEKNYNTILVNTNDISSTETKLINMLEASQVDGMLLILSNESCNESNKDKIIELLNNIDIPFVMVDRNIKGYECNKVYYDNEYGGYIAGKILMQKGHTKLACITSGGLSLSGAQRLSGFKRALKEYEIDENDVQYFEGDYTIDSGYKSCNYFDFEKITAVFSFNDMMTLGFLKGLKEKYNDMYNDITVVSYDNIEFLNLFDFDIYSVDQNVSVLAEKSCVLLNNLMDEKSLDSYEEIVLKPSLEKRSNGDFKNSI